MRTRTRKSRVFWNYGLALLSKRGADEIPYPPDSDTFATRAPFEWEKMRKRKSWIKIFWSLGGRLGFYTSRAFHIFSFWHFLKFYSRIRTDSDSEQIPKPYRFEISSESESVRNRNLFGIGIRSDSGNTVLQKMDSASHHIFKRLFDNAKRFQNIGEIK